MAALTAFVQADAIKSGFAAAWGSHDTLAAMFPSQRAAFRTELNKDLTAVTDTAARVKGILLALVNVAMADAGIAIWESKFYYDLWRRLPASARPTGAPDQQREATATS